MAGKLVPINFPAGASRNGTQYQTVGRWYDCNLVRWVQGVLRQVGGWSRFADLSVISGRCRTLHAWITNSSQPYLAIGTSQKLYVSVGTSVLKNITPSSFTPGGDDAYKQQGYGGGAYGAGAYGTVRDGFYLKPSFWHLDNFGERLVGVSTSDGKVIIWALDFITPTVATTVANSPSNCAGLIVSEQRHVVAFGAGGNPRVVQWSGKETETVWSPAANNEAGQFECATVGAFVKAVRVNKQILILYSTDAFVMNYIGQPYIFNRERVGTDCGPLGPGAVAVIGGIAVWMGDKGFWTYSGGVVSDLPCEVADFVFSNLNQSQASKVIAGKNAAFGEVWFFYPSGDSIEPDRYVIWNYREGHWAHGALARTAWVDHGVFTAPFGVGTDKLLYRHEQDFSADGNPMYPDVYVESGAIDIPYGDTVVGVNQIIPDEQTSGDLVVTLKTRYTPEGDEFAFGPYGVRPDGYTDTRASGRQIVMRVQPTRDADWRMGNFRMNIDQRGKR